MLSMIENNLVIYAMAVICVIGTIGKLAANKVYKTLARQSDNLAMAEDGWLRQLKTKYQTTYRGSAGMRNVSAFVEKNIYRYRKYGFYLYRLESLALHAGMLSLVLGLCSTLIAFLNELGAKTIIYQFSMGVILAIGMIFVDNLVDTETKRNILKASLCDYLSNMLVVRTPQEMVREREEGKNMAKKPALDDDVFMRKGKEKPKDRPGIRLGNKGKDTDDLKRSLEQIAAAREEDESGRPRKLTPKEEKLIEDIISEYLT